MLSSNNQVGENLWDRFRQQYSKFGSTREQYFHAWRSFQFNEATDTIDGYIHKVKQVAVLLDYGEPQILELFKNTLPSRLYYMLFQINDLRVAVETVKRLLIKEQMGKKAEQSIASPFMQISQSKDRMEKRVSSNAIEAMERTSDSIERLASIMDRMDTKLDRKEDQYRSRVYQSRNRGRGYGNNNYNSRNRSYSRDRYQNNYGERRNYSNRGNNRNHRSNQRDSSRSRDRNNYRDDNQYDHRMNYRGSDGKQRYSNRNQDHSRSRDRRNRSSSRESSQPRNSPQNRYKNRRQSRDNSRNRDSMSLDPDPLLE